MALFKKNFRKSRTTRAAETYLKQILKDIARGDIAVIDFGHEMLTHEPDGKKMALIRLTVGKA